MLSKVVNNSHVRDRVSISRSNPKYSIFLSAYSYLFHRGKLLRARAVAFTWLVKCYKILTVGKSSFSRN
jgi:hypothetical protein